MDVDPAGTVGSIVCLKTDGKAGSWGCGCFALVQIGRAPLSFFGFSRLVHLRASAHSSLGTLAEGMPPGPGGRDSQCWIVRGAPWFSRARGGR